MMRTFKTYSFSSSQAYSTVVLPAVIMLYITFPGLIYSITGGLCLLTPFTHFTHTLTPRFCN